MDTLQISAMDPGALPSSDVRVLELNRLSEQNKISDEDIFKKPGTYRETGRKYN